MDDVREEACCCACAGTATSDTGCCEGAARGPADDEALADRDAKLAHPVADGVHGASSRATEPVQAPWGTSAATATTCCVPPSCCA